MELQKRLRKQPFEPFRVVLSSGDAYEVRHPEMALLLKGGIYVAVPDEAASFPKTAMVQFASYHRDRADLCPQWSPGSKK